MNLRHYVMLAEDNRAVSLYQMTLDDTDKWHKDISTKYPNYNDPASPDHKNAVMDIIDRINAYLFAGDMPVLSPEETSELSDKLSAGMS